MITTDFFSCCACYAIFLYIFLSWAFSYLSLLYMSRTLFSLALNLMSTCPCPWLLPSCNILSVCNWNVFGYLVFEWSVSHLAGNCTHLQYHSDSVGLNSTVDTIMTYIPIEYKVVQPSNLIQEMGQNGLPSKTSINCILYYNYLTIHSFWVNLFQSKVNPRQANYFLLCSLCIPCILKGLEAKLVRLLLMVLRGV